MGYRITMSFLAALGVGMLGAFFFGISTDLFLHGDQAITHIGMKAAIVGGWISAMIAFIVVYHTIDY